MTTEVAARASETYRKTPNTFSFQYQSTVLLVPNPATVSRTSLPTNQTGNRQITLAGTTPELESLPPDTTRASPRPGQRAPSRTLGESRRQGVTAAARQRASGHRARQTRESGTPSSRRLTGRKAEPAAEVSSEGDPASRRTASAPPSRSAEPEGRGLGARARPRRNVESTRGRGCAGGRARGGGGTSAGEGRGLVDAPPPDAQPAAASGGWPFLWPPGGVTASSAVAGLCGLGRNCNGCVCFPVEDPGL